MGVMSNGHELEDVFYPMTGVAASARGKRRYIEHVASYFAHTFIPVYRRWSDLSAFEQERWSNGGAVALTSARIESVPTHFVRPRGQLEREAQDDLRVIGTGKVRMTVRGDEMVVDHVPAEVPEVKLCEHSDGTGNRADRRRSASIARKGRVGR